MNKPTLDPKARFIKSGGYQLLSELATNDLFHDALTFALASYTMTLRGDPASSVKLQGAQDFIETLLTLPDPVEPLKPQPPLRANLRPDYAKSKPTDEPAKQPAASS